MHTYLCRMRLGCEKPRLKQLLPPQKPDLSGRSFPTECTLDVYSTTRPGVAKRKRFSLALLMGNLCGLAGANVQERIATGLGSSLVSGGFFR